MRPVGRGERFVPFFAQIDADELFAEAEYCRRLAGETDPLTRRILLELAEQFGVEMPLAVGPRQPGQSSLPATVPDTANEVGWPQYVTTVEGVVAALPADERAHAVILTNDYSEASPLVLLGTGLPPVYSGHNAFWDWGPPSADRTVVVHVGDWRPTDYSQFFVGCHSVAQVDNGLGIQNAMQGELIWVCTGLRAPWSAMWPALRTIS